MQNQGLESLLRDCTVKVSTSKQSSTGTAFFIAPGMLLTCAHVVKSSTDKTAKVFWAKNNKTCSADIIWISPDITRADLALLKVHQYQFPSHPCVELDVAVEEGEEDLRVNDDLFSYGYMRDYRNGAGVLGKSEWFTGDIPPLIKFKGGQIKHGLSGAALLNLKTGRVCGVVKETRSATFPQGGGAVPISTAYQCLASIIDLHKLQKDFHQEDRKWRESAESFVATVTNPRVA